MIAEFIGFVLSNLPAFLFVAAVGISRPAQDSALVNARTVPVLDPAPAHRSVRSVGGPVPPFFPIRRCG